MKNTKTTTLIAISLSILCANASNAWDETDLPTDLGNFAGIGSNSYQFVTGTSLNTDDGWNSHVVQSGQDLSANIDLPANLGEYQSAEGEMLIKSEISNWQEYNRDLTIADGTAYQIGTETGTIAVQTMPIVGQETLAVASLNTTTTQSIEFKNTPLNGWETNQTMMSQKLEINTSDFNPGSEVPSVEYDARLEQGYDRTYTENGLTIHQGGWQENSVNINSTPGTTETIVIE